jgi:long-chain acyl-CoA synthetase
VTRDTLVDRFVARAETDALKPALWYKEGNTWRHYTWAEYVEMARHFAGALLAMGFEKGDGVAIMSYNNPEWVVADVATMMARGVPAGIYQTCTDEQATYIANHCEAVVLVLEDYAMWEHLGGEAFLDGLEHTREVVMIRDAERVGDAVTSFEDFLATGVDHQEAVDQRMAEIELEDLAMLIYTSGTTGPPKGVMLSHHNLAYTSRTAVELLEQADTGETLGGDDAIVSYLPLSHIAEQMFTIHAPITAGIPVWFAEEIAKLKDCLIIARPTIFLAVPRVWEKFRNALEARLEEATGLKKGVVDFSRKRLLEAGHVVVREGEEGLGRLQKLQYRAANQLFADKLKGALGLDRLKVAVTGAAPISLDVLEFFLSVGIIIHEVYGQSEDNGPTTFNYPLPGKRKLGSAGIPFPGVQVKIADDGEILVRGENVFMGYYKNPEATAETLVDGWLHSGDIGRFDEDGFLYITDRKKDLIITAGGKNVAPQNIEKLVRDIEGVGNAVIIGDRRKFLSALVTIDAEQGPALAARRGWPTDPHELAEYEPFREYLDEEIARRVNADLARYETIKKYTIIAEDFTVEGGELTPTQKVKRRVVNEKYSAEIEAFYAGLD